MGARGAGLRRLARRPATALLLLALAVAAATMLVRLLHGQPLLRFTADDAYITFRYSDHLAGGIGPVFNAVGPRVDGYTSPLWMALIALTHLLGVGDEAASKALSLAAFAAILGMLAYAGGARALLVRAAAMAALVASPVFVAIAVQGFETVTAGALAAVTTLLLRAAIKRPERGRLLALAGVAALAVFARPDLLPFAVVCFAGLGLWLWQAGERAALGRAAACAAAGFVLPGLVWAVWHRAYYGYLLPNTAYVKRGAGLTNPQSRHLVWTFLTDFALPVVAGLALLAVVALIARRRGRRERDPVAGAAWTAVAGAAAFLVAGLHFVPIQGDLWRFQMPIFPALLVAVVLLASREPRAAELGVRGRPAWRAVAVAATLAVCAYPLTTLGDVRAELGGRYTHDRRQAGRALARFRHDGLRMLVSESGALPWASGWTASDVLGLNDHHVALHGASPAYVESLRPDLLQFVVALGAPPSAYAGYHPFAELVRSGRFELATATLKTNSDLVAARPLQAHLYFVRRGIPRADDLVTTLRALRGVRRVPPVALAPVLRGLGYPVAGAG